MLFSPSRHERLGDSRWSDARARRAIAAIAGSTEAGFDSRIGLWPLHSYDSEPGSDHPMRSVYLGASGIIWALDQLAADGNVDLERDYSSVAERLEPEMVVEPDESAEWPADGFLGGRCGALAVAQRHRDRAERADLLLRLMAGAIEQPALELFYGAPGMMVLAAAEHTRTADVRFADVWRASAKHVLEQWHIDEQLGVRLWTQQLTPKRRDRFVGFGHGLAGNAFALLRGDLLEPDERSAVEHDAVATAKRLAIVDGDHANWPSRIDAPLESPSGIRTQWCHGAPGVIIALARACPDDDAWSDLLLAGGRTTWDAGPLRDRAGLCHGTAGNAYAFLALWQRTSDELWLQRARSFAKHALDQVERESLPWHSLFTGDLGVALCLRSCLEADARFPTLNWF